MKIHKYKTTSYFVKVLFLIGGMWGIHSCTDNFTEYNTDKTQIMEVGTTQLTGLFSRSEIQGVSWLSTDNYSRMSSEVANHFCGYIATGQTSQEENVMHASHQRRGWQAIYSKAYPALQSIFDVVDDQEATYNVALVWKVFLLHRMTDLWGPVPYTEAGSGQETVAYDSQKDIYYKMFEELDAAVTALTAALKDNSVLTVFGTGDMIYSGDVSKWIKFANTLRLRLAIRISNIDPDKAQAEAEAAIAGETMDSNDDDALLDVTAWADGGNGMPRMNSFNTNVMSASMESVLKGYRDPRMQEFFSPVDASNIPDDYPELQKNNGGYHGMANGYEPSYVNFISGMAFSFYGPRFEDGNQQVTPINVINSAETWFLKAEGAWRGWNMGGTAQEFYEKGIEISIKQWREGEISDDSIQNYINSTLTPVAPDNYPYDDPAMTDIPVKFSSDSEEQYEQIMTQKWLALWPISFEAWAEYRRTRLPNIYAKKYSANANVLPSKGQIVTRLPFSTDEASSNTEEVNKAIEFIGGEDLETIPLWWDVNDN